MTASPDPARPEPTLEQAAEALLASHVAVTGNTAEADPELANRNALVCSGCGAVERRSEAHIAECPVGSLAAALASHRAREAEREKAVRAVLALRHEYVSERLADAIAALRAAFPEAKEPS